MQNRKLPVSPLYHLNRKQNHKQRVLPLYHRNHTLCRKLQQERPLLRAELPVRCGQSQIHLNVSSLLNF
jgi:hypothetical protein